MIPPGFPAADPPAIISQDSIGRRIYTVEELLSLREKNKGLSDLKLPDKINRNLLEPSLRKRKYPFESGRRKSDATNPSRWEGKQGKWRDKHRKDADHIDEIEEIDEHDERRDPNEASPDWADVDEDKIKRDVKNFQFQALDREEEREMFAQTGNIPDKPKLAPKEEPKTTNDEKNLVASLFRQAEHNSMPQLPENAVDANQLEKSGNKHGSSLFGPGVDNKPVKSEDEPLRPLGLFDFAGFNREAKNEGDNRADEMGGFSAQDLRNRGDLSRPIGRSAEYVRAIGESSPNFGGRSPNPHPPHSGMPEDPNKGAPEFDMNVPSRLNDPGSPPNPRKRSSNSPANENENGPSANHYDPTTKAAAAPVKTNADPILRLDNILYEITDPVRPCVGGQFFAAARPLTNKELYDYSPKFKEIQDRRLDSMRHKQMMRHSMNQQRKRIMMAKYAQAKQMYEKYPVPPEYRGRGRVPPGVPPEYRGRGYDDQAYGGKRPPSGSTGY